MARQSPESKRRSRKRLKGPAVPRGWMEVATAPDLMSAGMLESVLKAEGIPVMLNRPPVFSFLGSGGIHGVLVPAESEAEARGILSEVWEVERPPDGEDGG